MIGVAGANRHFLFVIFSQAARRPKPEEVAAAVLPPGPHKIPHGPLNSFKVLEWSDAQCSRNSYLIILCIYIYSIVRGTAPLYIKALSLQIDYSPLPGDNKCRADTSQVCTHSGS